MAAVSMPQIIEALKKTVDPEIGLNIIDLGLLYNISISPSSDVDIRITMTSPMCPVTSIILADVQLRVEHIEGVGKVNVDLVWEPAWNPEMISEEARLGLQ
jgi:metal-sulfur cluster biosynthetic enzyme